MSMNLEANVKNLWQLAVKTVKSLYSMFSIIPDHIFISIKPVAGISWSLNSVNQQLGLSKAYLKQRNKTHPIKVLFSSLPFMYKIYTCRCVHIYIVCIDNFK